MSYKEKTRFPRIEEVLGRVLSGELESRDPDSWFYTEDGTKVLISVGYSDEWYNRGPTRLKVEGGNRTRWTAFRADNKFKVQFDPRAFADKVSDIIEIKRVWNLGQAEKKASNDRKNAERDARADKVRAALAKHPELQGEFRFPLLRSDGSLDVVVPDDALPAVLAVLVAHKRLQDA